MSAVPLRIAIVHDNAPGGAARATWEKGRRLAERGHAVDVWTLHDAPAPPGATPRRAGVGFAPLLPLGGLSAAVGPLAPLEAARLDRAWAELAAAVDAGGYDVVLTEGCQHLQQPRVHRRLRTPCVAFVNEVHRAVHERPAGLGLRRAVLAAHAPWHALLARAERAELLAARAVLTLSHHMAATLRRVLDVAAQVVHLGVDARRFRPLDLPRERVVLCPSAIHRRKRQDLLVEAVGRLPAATRPRLLLLYSSEGRGHVERLRALAAARGVALELRKGVDDEGLVEAYNRAAVVGYVPEAEPFGLVPLEALACGTPVVGAREGGVAETLEDGVTGLLVSADPDAIAAALARLLDDPALAARLGAAGRARVVERWGWDRTVDQVEAALRDACRRRGAAPYGS